MSTRNTLTDRFETSLGDVDVSVTRASVATLEDALADVVTEPAVGVDLPFDGVTLAETSITVDPTPEQLRAARTGVTPASGGITDYGSLLLRCTGDGAEFLALYPDRHVVAVRASDVVEDMPDGIDAIADTLRDEAGDVIVATGPSATADMGSVVQGVHGPSDVHVVLLEDA